MKTILVAHMSMAGGYHKAVEAARRVGCDCVQLFTKNNNQWRAKPITDDEARLFKESLGQQGITHPIAHDSYLINLASPAEELWNKSIDAFTEELLRAETLGIPYVVTHPGAFLSTSEEEGLRRVATALDEVHRRLPGVTAKCLLETTAGQGSTLGWRFEHLRSIFDQVTEPERLGVCVDTCHVFAAGYALSPAEAYAETLDQLDRVVGLPRIRAFHLNDSKRERGSRVDRHAHIGEGHLGLEAFRLLINDSRFTSIPMYLETPKETVNGVERDVTNLATLRSLWRQTEPCPEPPAPPPTKGQAANSTKRSAGSSKPDRAAKTTRRAKPKD